MARFVAPQVTYAFEYAIARAQWERTFCAPLECNFVDARAVPTLGRSYAPGPIRSGILFGELTSSGTGAAGSRRTRVDSRN